ncbi:MAG: PEP-CTERM sorting domain-containing protein [Acidobacteria bacterium]|nr:PEP-CTERM sorting domain-containing protein [Acidobacteriota bacterium]
MTRGITARLLMGLGVVVLAAAPAAAQAIITNGTVTLGVRELGNLNVADPTGAYDGAPSFTPIVGLRSNATNSDSTSPGCTCEGWGVGLRSTNISGYANDSVGTANLTLVNFSSTASTAVSTVTMANGANGGSLEITHNYRPNAFTDYLYQVDVSITNNTGADLVAGDLVYRRVMDWDIPYPASELVTIQGVPAVMGLPGSNLYRSDNNGFNSGNPFSFSSFGLLNQNFTDEGPQDHGALFDFEFEALANGATRTFTTYYGVAPNKSAADIARFAVNGDPLDEDIGLYSYGIPTEGQGGIDTSTGAPNTFIFGFGAAGGILDPSTDTTTTDTTGAAPEPASLGLLAMGLFGARLARRRRSS